MFYHVTVLYEKINLCCRLFFRKGKGKSLRTSEHICSPSSCRPPFLQILPGTCKTFYNLSPSSRLFFSSLSSQDFVSLGPTPPDRPDPRPIQVFLFHSFSLAAPLSILGNSRSPFPSRVCQRDFPLYLGRSSVADTRDLFEAEARERKCQPQHIYLGLCLFPLRQKRESNR